MNMKLIGIIVFLVFYLFVLQEAWAKKDSSKETALFEINAETQKIISLKKDVVSSLALNFISVTTDQPIYWTNEEVHLKLICPIRPHSSFNLLLQKKDSTPQEIGPVTLNEAGILVETILSGKEKKLEAGEYRIEVHSEDGSLSGYASFSVVEGALGAVSFAHDFKEVTSAEELGSTLGAWFLGNAAGAGLRWGNGLNVKNEIRIFNQPFEGEAVIKSRCYLPGCDGIEAGPSVYIDIKKGQLETVLDVGGHSGPFEIEVITEKGTIRYLFSRSGHIERQAIPVSSGLTNCFSVSLAPYQESTPLLGRGLYVIEGEHQDQDPVELPSVITNQNQKLELQIKQKIINSRLFLLFPDKKGNFQVEEVKINETLDKGQKILLDVQSPMTFIAIGGFIENQAEIFEGWAMIFTETTFDIGIKIPNEGHPLQKSIIEISIFDRFNHHPLLAYGILEVFDNRVASKSPREPLISALGDSFRNLSNYLVSWRDWTGIIREERPAKGLLNQIATLFMSKDAAAPSSTADDYKMETPLSALSASEEINITTESVPQETIREGEKKVVYCGIFQTDQRGKAKILVELPPQIGRCTARVVVIDQFDYQEKTQMIDVQKKNYIEVDFPNIIIPGAMLNPQIQVVNTELNSLILKISGAGLAKPVTFTIEPGTTNPSFQMTGENYGSLLFELLGTQGKIFDQRVVEIHNVESFPTTFTDIFVSEGNPVLIEPHRRIAAFSNPAQLLRGMVTTIETNIYSWFGHAEAVSASCALRALLLTAIEKNLIDDEGMAKTLISEVIKGVNDLDSVFMDTSSNLIAPYPGLKGEPLWSIWVMKNLSIMISALKNSSKLMEELGPTLDKAQNLVNIIIAELKKRHYPIKEEGYFDPEENQNDLIPIEIDGKVVYKSITDKAVVHWFVEKIWPVYFDAPVKNMRDINLKFITAYDTYRFLRAFERSGVYYYLLLNAKALFLQNDPRFYEVFKTIAKGMILTQDPGMIQGPALLGGVYSSPNTMVKFLELLLLMMEKNDILANPVLHLEMDGKTQTISLGDKPFVLEPIEVPVKLTSPNYVIYQADRNESISLFHYLTDEKPFFSVTTSRNYFSVGEEGTIRIELDYDKDPSEYYALVVAPSVLSIRQTTDLLSDYKGQIIYGQKTLGGVKMQMITAPFRGAREMVLEVEGTYQGKSEGLVLVRHISNPNIIQAVKIPAISVQ